MKALKNKWEAAGKDKENLEELGLFVLKRHSMSWDKEASVTYYLCICLHIILYKYMKMEISLTLRWIPNTD